MIICINQRPIKKKTIRPNPDLYDVRGAARACVWSKCCVASPSPHSDQSRHKYKKKSSMYRVSAQRKWCRDVGSGSAGACRDHPLRYIAHMRALNLFSRNDQKWKIFTNLKITIQILKKIYWHLLINRLKFNEAIFGVFGNDDGPARHPSNKSFIVTLSIEAVWRCRFSFFFSSGLQFMIVVCHSDCM